MFGNPVVEVVGLFSVGLAGDDNDGAVGLDLVARDLDASLAGLLERSGERRLARAALARGFLRGRALDLVGLRLKARCPPLRLPFLMLAALLREPSGKPFVGRLVGGIPPAGSHCLGRRRAFRAAMVSSSTHWQSSKWPMEFPSNARLTQSPITARRVSDPYACASRPRPALIGDEGRSPLPRAQN